jgi:DmsE family decaheme c-type cytochrome
VGEHALRTKTPALCYGCHLEVRAKFALVERHKVNEGVVSCLDCHRPHGSANPAALRAPDDRTCFRCHGDLEGPWVFEHAGNVTEGCQRCHDPHGSVNRHLLIRQQVAQLCYECHTVTPSNHIQPSYRDCTRCHVSIHGSNTDPRFLEQ